MLEVFKTIVNFFSVDISWFAPYVLIGLLISFVIIFIIETVLSCINGVKNSKIYYFAYLIVNLIATLYFSVEDYSNDGVIFKSVKSVYTFIAVVSVLSVLFYLVVIAVSKKQRVTENAVIKNNNDTIEEVSPSRIVEYFKNDKFFMGYLDVNYVKSLIKDLKNKNLSEGDYQKIEELELYLMRFSQRQPFDKERAELSEKLSMLIKQLAKYAC